MILAFLLKLTHMENLMQSGNDPVLTHSHIHEDEEIGVQLPQISNPIINGQSLLCHLILYFNYFNNNFLHAQNCL